MVTNNVIHDVDYMALDCAGINTGNGGGDIRRLNATSTYNTISDNTIYNSGRGLILIRNMGSGVVVNNDLYDGMLQTARRRRHLQLPTERPGLQLSGQAPGPDTVIAYNRIHDMPTPTRRRHLPRQRVAAITWWITTWFTTCPTRCRSICPSNDNLVYNNTLLGCSQSIWDGLGHDRRHVGHVHREQPLHQHCVNLGTESSAASTATTSRTPRRRGSSIRPRSTSNSSPTRRRWTPGMVIPGYTDGYVGSAPDIGCFEYGRDPLDRRGQRRQRTPTSAPIPATPLDLTATSPAASQMDLAWQNNDANATSCVVEWAPDGCHRSRRSLACRATPLPTWTRR